MRVALALALAVPLCLARAQAPTPPKDEFGTKLPPVLDRELFLGRSEITHPELSPDGTRIAFLKPWKGITNIWVKPSRERYSRATRLTANFRRSISGFFWSRDGRYILFVQDKEGDGTFNVDAVDPAAPPAPGQDVPEFRPLTAAKGSQAIIYAVPKSEPDTLIVGLNDRDETWPDLYKVRISSGECTLLWRNTEHIDGWIFDQGGQPRLGTRMTQDGGTEILRLDPGGSRVVYTCSAFEQASPIAFHRDGKRVYLKTNKGHRDLVQLVLFDPQTSREELVESDPMKRVDFGEALFSEVSGALVGTSYEDARMRVYFRDKSLASDDRLLKRRLGGRELSFLSSTADGQLVMVSAYGDQDPGTWYLFDRRTKRLTLDYITREELPRSCLAAMNPLRYPSSDGLMIPAYLTLPRGVPARNLPLIVFPHGGPWARDSWKFNNYAQFLANRGYAVLCPNFRGSTGYGKKFLDAGNRQWGWLMQDDLTWGVKFLVKQGIADPRRIGIMGGSYGGFAALAGITFTPDLYRAAVSIVGPSNLITLLDSIPPYWEAGRTLFQKRIGNTDTPSGRRRLERQSPLNAASRIHTPLMIALGARDPGTKKAESEAILISLRDRNIPIQYLLMPDEGHIFSHSMNNLAMLEVVETFLAKQLGGRFQEGGIPEVTKHLLEIQVDPATLTRPANPSSDPDSTTNME